MMEPVQKELHFDLIDQCRRGEKHAYNRLYNLYSKAMFNVALRIVNDHGDAEDVLQEAFIAAFKNLKAFKGDSTFGAWIKRIVVNKSINHLNKKRLATESVEEYPDVEAIQEQSSVLFSVKAIKTAIAQLPDGYRTVLTLYLFEGYDHGEISQILNISESTSKSQLNRSKKKLIQLLKQK